MLVIGIIGGIASGKSLVASQFQSLGAGLLDADRVGHEVLREPEVVEEVVAEWGPSLVIDGEVNRAGLAKIVFAGDSDGLAALARLEAITHPRIRARLERQLADWKSSNRYPAVVLDVPLLVKTGWRDMCDRVVFVDVSPQIREARAAARGWNREEWQRRESHQASLEMKRSVATDRIENSTTPESCFQQVLALWQAWGLPTNPSSNLSQPTPTPFRG